MQAGTWKSAAGGAGAAPGTRQVNNYGKGGKWRRAASPSRLGRRGCEAGGLGALRLGVRVPGAEEMGMCGGRGVCELNTSSTPRLRLPARVTGFIDCATNRSISSLTLRVLPPSQSVSFTAAQLPKGGCVSVFLLPFKTFRGFLV